MLDDCLKARGNCNNCDRKNMCFPKKEKKTENTYCGSRNFTQRRKNNGKNGR